MRAACGSDDGGPSRDSAAIVVAWECVRSMRPAFGSVPVLTGQRSTPHAVVGGHVYETVGAGDAELAAGLGDAGVVTGLGEGVAGGLGFGGPHAATSAPATAMRASRAPIVGHPPSCSTAPTPPG